MFSTSYSRTEDGGLLLVVATPQDGPVLTMRLTEQEALTNLLAFADTLGLRVVGPAP